MMGSQERKIVVVVGQMGVQALIEGMEVYVGEIGIDIIDRKGCYIGIANVGI